MKFFLVITFLFFAGSLIEWGIELIFRRFFSKNNPERKWINPGFLTGPYLPLYGFSLVILFLLSYIDVSFILNPHLQKVVLFALMALSITFFEYIAGMIFIVGMKIRLWDYSKNWGNIKGNRLSAVHFLLVAFERDLLLFDSSKNSGMAFLVHESHRLQFCRRIFLRRPLCGFDLFPADYD